MKSVRRDTVSLGASRRTARGRTLSAESLEDRCLLTSTPLTSPLEALLEPPMTEVVAEPMTEVVAEPMAGSASPTGFTPTQLRTAYGFNQIFFENNTIVGDGSGQTIAIVNAYHTPNAASDLAAFANHFGLPGPPSFIQVDQNGGTNYPASNSAWALETAMDVQWAHAFAPGASILLVETNSASFNDLTAGVNFARNYPGVSVVSMSWGAAEWAGESFFNQFFTTPVGKEGVTFFGAAGNSGGPGVYPAYSPNVTAVGGTTLTLNAMNQIVSETAWSGSGGGISQFQLQPSWQNGVATQSATHRVMPDVAFLANPTTGVSVYDTFNNSPGTPWSKVAGTSFATPAWAALVAVANQGRVLAGLPVFDTTTLMTKLYTMPTTNFNDIVSGSSGGTIPQSAGVGFDAVTGLGTPKAALIVNSLVDATATPSGVVLTAASDTGISNSDGITKLNNSSPGNVLQFNVSGTITGATVNLYADGTLIGSAVAVGSSTLVTTNGTFTLVDGVRSITARQVQPGKGMSAATAALPITIDTVAPTASFVAVSPDPRTTPVDSITLQFSEVVSGLNLAALMLSRDAGPNLLSGAQSVTTLDGVNWTINHLSGVTSLSGLYELILTSALSPVTDVAGNVAGNALETFTMTAAVLGRMLFYNQSVFDGGSAAINAADDGAIAPDKTAYLPGSGIATFANISSYSRGINGVMVDITGSHPNITAADFEFRVGNSNDLGTWVTAPAPVAVSVRAGAGAEGGDRVTIVWANGAIANQWLEVRVLATANTGLAEADVFYFGSRVGDTGTNSPPTIAVTNVNDEIETRNATAFGVGITNLYDFDRSGVVNVSDQITARNNFGITVKLNLSTPAAPEAMPAVAGPGPEPGADDAAPTEAAPPAAPLVDTSADPPPDQQSPDRNLLFAAAHRQLQRWMGRGGQVSAGVEVDDELLGRLVQGRLRLGSLRR